MRAIALAKPAARLLVAFLVLALCWPGDVARAQEGPPADWSGTWDTRWRDGGSRLILQQDGRTVTGSYPLYSGRIEARAVGRTLRGRWIEDGRSGNFVFAQSQDGASLAGRFGSGEWRIGPIVPGGQ
jgi:MscS family membrane protein